MYAAARLGIANQLKTGSKSYTELATLTGSHAPSVYRLMRALASVGVFAETEVGIFTLTPLSHCLRSDVPESLRDVWDGFRDGGEVREELRSQSHSFSTGWMITPLRIFVRHCPKYQDCFR
ncbi:methyltransferase family protein [Leptodesmis sp.]|uniref:methyltransferase family protein n=1 Tax=Leptodesmis sp. TaxID=3100501 RepID=UPI0040534F06